MNPEYAGCKYPPMKSLPWEKVFRYGTPPDSIRFVSKLLQYDPDARPTPLGSLLDPFFDELRDENTKLPNG